MFYRTPTAGFTLLEIAIAVAIFAAIGSIVFSPLAQFRTQRTLDAAVEETLAAFSRAHFDTISALNDVQYGVHLDANQAVYFVGTSYDANAVTNRPYVLSDAIEIANIALTGGGANVIFQRLGGGTAQSGTFEIRAKSNTTKTSVVTINATGAVSL